MNTFIKYLLRGCLVLAPLAATIYVVYWIVERIDALLSLPIPGLGFVATILGVALVGYLTSGFLGRTVVSTVDALVAKLPFVRLVYNSLKDLVGTFLREKKTFDRPALVTLSRESGARALGLVTRDAIHAGALVDHIAVYFPFSYSLAGTVLLFPRSDVQILEGTPSSDFVAFIVSGGMSGSIGPRV